MEFLFQKFGGETSRKWQQHVCKNICENAVLHLLNFQDIFGIVKKMESHFIFFVLLCHFRKNQLSRLNQIGIL